MNSTRHVPLEIVPEPAAGTRAVLVVEKGPVFVGENPGITYDCGYCGQGLIEGMTVGEIGNVVIRCPTCGMFNEGPA